MKSFPNIIVVCLLACVLVLLRLIVISADIDVTATTIGRKEELSTSTEVLNDGTTIGADSSVEHGAKKLRGAVESPTTAGDNSATAEVDYELDISGGRVHVSNPLSQQLHDILDKHLREEKHVITLLMHELQRVTRRFVKQTGQVWETQKGNLRHEIVIELKISEANIQELEEIVNIISDPENFEDYGQHLSLEEVNSILHKDRESEKEVLTFLHAIKAVYDNNMEIEQHSGEFIVAKASLSTWERIFGATFNAFLDSSSTHSENEKEVYWRAESFSLPKSLLNSIQYIYQFIDFPASVLSVENYVNQNASSGMMETLEDTEEEHHSRQLQVTGYVNPSLLRQYYQINPSVHVGNSLTSQAVYAYNQQYLSTSDLTVFQQRNQLPLQAISTNIGGFIAVNGCSLGQCVEANLDVQYLMGIAPNIPTTFYSWSGNADPWLSWIKHVATLTNPPNVISISYGSNEADVTTSYFHSFKLQALKLAARGVTIIVSVGDYGASAGTTCGYVAQFPSTVPYVTAVGGTQGPEKGTAEVACTTSISCLITTGGGFSNKFSTPAWQKASVDSFLASGSGTSTATGFNRNGRGYPDVSLLAHNYEIIMNGVPAYVSGTSASTPTFAAMISLINAKRLQSGKSALGWINPMLYNPSFRSLFIRDITVGSNNCNQQKCCTQGFQATTGWDPVTGVGSISSFGNFYDTLIKLPNNQFVPTATPTRSPAATFSPSFRMTRTPTITNSGWAVNSIYSTSTCTGEVLKFSMYPLERCLPIVKYNSATLTISTLAYKKYSCGAANVAVSYYSDSACRTLLASRPVETTARSCLTNTVEDNYYYNAEVVFSSLMTCSTVRNYTSIITKSTNTAMNRYVIQASYSDISCASNRLTSYEVYRDQRCYNLNDNLITTSDANNAFEFVFPALYRYGNVKCDDEKSSYSRSQVTLTNTNQCSYSSTLTSGKETSTLADNWFLYVKN